MTRPVVLFGLIRGGSSITARLMHILALSSGWELHNPLEEAYNNGVRTSDIPTEAYDRLPRQNAIFGPFREYDAAFERFRTEKYQKVIVMRDLRDCVVSQYFAYGHIHSVFREGQLTDLNERGRHIRRDLDTYAQDEIANYLAHARNYLDVLSSEPEHTLLYRYEDIAYDPITWLQDVVQKTGLCPDAAAFNQAVIEAAFWRAHADVNEHNRSGQSGGFTQFLSPETQANLWAQCGDVMARFGYDKEPQYARDRYVTTTRQTSDLARLLYNQRLQIDELKRAVSSLQSQNGQRMQELNNLYQILSALDAKVKKPARQPRKRRRRGLSKM